MRTDLPSRPATTLLSGPSLAGRALLAAATITMLLFCLQGCAKPRAGAAAQTRADSEETTFWGGLNYLDVAPDAQSAVVSGLEAGIIKDGTESAICTDCGGAIRVLDTLPLRERKRIEAANWTGPVRWVSEREFVVAVDDTLQLHRETEPPQVLTRGVADVAFARTRDAALIRDTSGKQYRVVSLPGGELRSTFARAPDLEPEMLLLPNADSPLAVLVQRETAYLRQLNTGERLEVGPWPNELGRVTAADISTSGKHVVLGSSNAETMYFVLDGSGEGRQGLSFGDGGAKAVAVSGDGRFVAWGTSAGVVALLDAATGKLNASLGRHQMPVLACAFIPGEPGLLTSSFDSVLRWSFAPEPMPREPAAATDAEHPPASRPEDGSDADSGPDAAIDSEDPPEGEQPN